MGSRVQNVRWSFGFFMIILHFGSFWAICCKSFEETKTVNLNPWCRLLESHIFLLLSPFPETNVCINRRKSSPTISYCCSHVVAHPINLDLRLAAARSSDMLCRWLSYPNKSSLWLLWFLLEKRLWSVEGPLVHRRRPSWGRSCRHSPWRACPPKSESPARRLVA